MKLKTMDDVVVHLDRISSMLQIYEEHIEEELTALERGGDGIVPHFVLRYDLLRHQLDVIQAEIRNAYEVSRGFLE